MAEKTQGSRMRRTIRRAALAGAATAFSLAAATTAAGAPTTWLPNATLTCDGVTFAPDEWVAVPPSDSLWITSGDLAGHYVILEDTHYMALTPEEAARAATGDYSGLPQIETRKWGKKTGLTGPAFTCDIFSQWGDGGEGTFWVVGTATIARAPGASR